MVVEIYVKRIIVTTMPSQLVKKLTAKDAEKHRDKEWKR
jgi:hypothetical protein